MKHYSVNGKSKVVTAIITRLTDKEMAEVQRYVALGYTVVDGKPAEKATVKRLDDKYILEYLKGDTEAIKAYNAAKKAPVLNPDGTIKTTEKNGVEKPKVQGFNAGRNWFAKNYPKDLAELALTDEQKETIDNAFAKYSKSKKDAENKQSKDEYTRYYYWTKIFVQK